MIMAFSGRKSDVANKMAPTANFKQKSRPQQRTSITICIEAP